MIAETHLLKHNLQKEIVRLKKEKNAVILAHYYQEPGIQDVADFVGDSLGLSQQAASTKADIIVFAGVHFMAETAKILNPSKKVLLPDLEAGCSLAESCQEPDFKRFLKSYPEHVVVSYINCSAAVKALSDVICTSANAVDIINAIPKEQPIVFAPDKNLGAYLAKKTGRDLVLWDGVCEVHDAFSLAKLLGLLNQHPSAKVVVHPESDASILGLADFVGSTSAMLGYVGSSKEKEFIVATEAGILYQMKKDFQDKIFIPAPAKQNNSCACSECPYMKMNTLEKLYDCLKHESPEIKLEHQLRERALAPIHKMLSITNKSRSN
ncbi:MAG: quinolinate synthase NadA [Bacteroidia bacterium]|nr:quinolinate synthase NadA [Bacteroidia bacterium]